MTRSLPWLLLIAALAFGGYARFADLERASFGHPENYVPGFEDPAWVTAPRARRATFVDVLKANLDDGHPPFWFTGMFGWTEVFGTDLRSLRLPSAIFGTLCIVLAAALARREGGLGAAVFAAALVALNGHLIFWSRFARMYSFAAFLALLATLLLLRIFDRGGRGAALLYVVAAGALLWTQAYGFAVVLAHGLLVATSALTTGVARPIAVRAVAAAVCCGAPVITLAIFQNPPTSFADPISEVFELGFAFFTKAEFFAAAPARPPTWVSTAPTLIGLALACAAAALRRPSIVEPPAVPTAESDPAPGGKTLLFVAACATLGQAAFAFRMAGRSAGGAAPLYASCFVAPVVFLLAGPVAAALRRFAGRRRGIPPLRALASPTFVLALVPIGVMAAISLRRPSFVARGASIYVPFLLAAIAVGVASIARRREPAAPGKLAGSRRVVVGVLVAWTLVVSEASRRYFDAAEAAPRDYAALAARLREEMGPRDVVLVQGGYADPPLLYYLRDRVDRVVPRGAVDEAFPDARTRRTWVVLYDDDPLDGEVLAPLGARTETKRVEAHRAKAIAFDPK